MAVKVGINGFGRIGRLVFRLLDKHPGYQVVAINDIGAPEVNAHLLAYDSTHGRFDGDVRLEGKAMMVNGQRVDVLQEKDPAKLPWKALGVDYVVEGTGKFTSKEQCALHLQAGAKKVLLTAPAKDEVDAMIVMGVNHGDLKAAHKIVSNASCTTNCLAPMAKVLHEAFGIERGFMNTVHAYTNDQRILDQEHKDLRRARAAMNIIPTSTGAAKAVGKVLPALKGRLDGFSLRVPVQDGSIVDLTAILARPPKDVAELNAALRAAAEGPMKPWMKFTMDPIVSCDVVGDPASCTVDGLSSQVLGNLVKVLGWYDNEWGYSSRCVDLLDLMVKLG